MLGGCKVQMKLSPPWEVLNVDELDQPIVGIGDKEKHPVDVNRSISDSNLDQIIHPAKGEVRPNGVIRFPRQTIAAPIYGRFVGRILNFSPHGGGGGVYVRITAYPNRPGSFDSAELRSRETYRENGVVKCTIVWETNDEGIAVRALYTKTTLRQIRRYIKWAEDSVQHMRAGQLQNPDDPLRRRALAAKEKELFLLQKRLRLAIERGQDRG